MIEWFQAGGFGMWVILAIGVGAIGASIRAAGKPSAERIAVLRALPALIVTSALFGFGANLWAILRHLGSESFLKAHGIAEGQTTLAGLLGFAEAGQVFTLAGLLTMLVLALRMVAESRHAQAAQAAHA
jgi:hypothetical protein